MEIFKGFEIKYPEYSVVTPQTVKEFTIRSLTVDEEETLKTSLVTPNKMTEHLNKIIYNCLVNKPDDIKTFEDYLNKLTIRDRDALMYGLYHITYKDIHNYDVTCSSCSKVNIVKVDFVNSFSMEKWPEKDKPVLEKEVKVLLETANNVTVVIKQPTLNDEAELMKGMLFSSDEERDKNMNLLMVSKFEIDHTETKTAEIIKERNNILYGYKQLPASDRKLIESAYADNFGKYAVDLKTIVKCQFCTNEDEISIDLVRQFFRAMYE